MMTCPLTPSEEARRFEKLHEKIGVWLAKKQFPYSGDTIEVAFGVSYKLKHLRLLFPDAKVERLQQELLNCLQKFSADVQNFEQSFRKNMESKLEKELPYCWIWYDSRRHNEKHKLEKYGRLLEEKKISVRSTNDQCELKSTLRLQQTELKALDSETTAQSFIDAFADCFQSYTQQLALEKSKLLSVVGDSQLGEEALFIGGASELQGQRSILFQVQ